MPSKTTQTQVTDSQPWSIRDWKTTPPFAVTQESKRSKEICWNQNAMPVLRSGSCCCSFFVLRVLLYTGKLLEDVASYLFWTEEGGGSSFLPGSVDSPHSDIRKPAGFYTTVRRIFFLNCNILVIFLPLTWPTHRNRLSSRVKEQHYIEITSLPKSLNWNEDKSTATVTFCRS